MRRTEWGPRGWSPPRSWGWCGVALSAFSWPDLLTAQDASVSTGVETVIRSSLPTLNSASTAEIRAELARREASIRAEAEKFQREDRDAANLAEQERISKEFLGDLRLEQNERVLDVARQLDPDVEKVGILTRAARVFSRNGDTDDAREAAREIAPAPFDPAAFERAKALILIADAERLSGDVKQSWWSLHEAQELALKFRDRDQALTIFRQIGTVEAKLSGGQATSRGLENDDLIEATIQNGLPNPGLEEVEILRIGGGPLREPQVIRHVYFPTGARKFPGPWMRGGQTIVCVVHPRTHCLCEAHIVLPRGAPIIEYSNDEIDYLYSDVEINLHFHRSGKCTVRASQFDTSLKKWANHLTPNLDESGFWFFGGETNALKNTVSLVSGPVLEVGSRLPITSGLIRPEDKRIRNTLKTPSRLNFAEMLKNRSVR